MTALAKTDSRITSLREHLDLEAQGIAALLPDNMPPERFARIVLTAAQSSPALANPAMRGSLMMAVLNCAALGLEPNTPIHEAVIIPRGNDAVLQIEYRGILELARQSGQVRNLTAATVRKGDKFAYTLGDMPSLVHEPVFPPSSEPYAYYACARVNGDLYLEVMTREEVEAHRDRYSDAYNKAVREGKTNTPWIERFNRMAEKTMLHQLERWLPKRVRLAIQVDQAYASGGRAEVMESGEIRLISAEEAGIEQDIDEAMPDEPIDVKASDPRRDEAEAKLQRRREELAPPEPATAAEEEGAAEEPAAVEALRERPKDAPVGDIDQQGWIKYSGKVRHIATFTVRTRTARSTETVECPACGEEIAVDEKYFDAGPKCRVHEACGLSLSQHVIGEEAPVAAEKKDDPPAAASPTDPAAELLTGHQVAEELGITLNAMADLHRRHADALPWHMVPKDDGGERLMYEPSVVGRLREIIDSAKAATLKESMDKAPRLSGDQKFGILTAAIAGIGVDSLMVRLHTKNPNWTALDDIPASAYEKVLAMAKGE